MLAGFLVIHSTDARIVENMLQQEAHAQEPLESSTHGLCTQRTKSAPKEK
jgi:hypothetical protein